MRAVIYLSLAIGATAIPLDERQAAAPTATISNGRIIGTSSGNVDSFSGIPFAQPPVGDLRLRAPRSLSAPYPGGTFAATSAAPACPQYGATVDVSAVPAGNQSQVASQIAGTPFGQSAPARAAEDCLTLTVQRPAGVASNAGLPVLFYIYGGGFNTGQSSVFDGGNFIRTSVTLGQPIIYVAVSYRLGAYGFLHGAELSGEGNTNIGLRDQRLGLEWVADNIAAFGGDPTKVTIWGESAGAISVFDQTIINGGDNRYKGRALFRGAIMNSGSIISAIDSRSTKAQGVYNNVVSAAGCSGAANTLTCLRNLSASDFQNAANSIPGPFSYSSLNLAYLPRPDAASSFFRESPEVAVAAGRFAKVPVIIGDQEDEGTLFSLVQSNISTNAQLVQYFASYFSAGNPSAVSDVTTYVAQYPDQPLQGQPAGSPFRTGGSNNIYPQYKRVAAIVGDLVFTLTRRVYLDQITKQGVTAWSYLATFGYAVPILGTFHASDILQAFSDPAGNRAADTFQRYYISFVNNLDPNAISTAAPLIQWPTWQNSTTQLLELGIFGNAIINDTFRQGAYDVLKARISRFRV